MSYEILIQQGFWMHLSKEAISNPLCFITSPEEPREIYSQHQTVPLAHTLLTIYHTCYCYYRKVRFPAVFSIHPGDFNSTIVGRSACGHG
jgi:hypothetical protein